MRAGNYLETAAKAVGVSKVTVYSWLKRGDAGEEPFKTFLNAYEKAEAQAEVDLVQTVKKASQAGPQHWPAAMTQMSRRWRERWADKVDGESGPKVVVQIGIQASDVSVSILSPVPRNDLTELSTGQVLHEGLINTNSVNQPAGAENP